MMEMDTEKIYVRFVDGVSVGIPVDARRLPNGNYQILPNDEFDYDDDSTLFEFGPLDVVKVEVVEVKTTPFENSRTALAASELVDFVEKRNLHKRMLFNILVNQPAPDELFRGVSRDEVNLLLTKIDNARFMYPAIREWASHYREYFKGLQGRE